MDRLKFAMELAKVVLIMAAFLIGLNLYFKISEVLEMVKLFILSQ